MRLEEVISRSVPLVFKGGSSRYMVAECGEPSSLVVDTLYGWWFWHAKGLQGNKYDWLRLVEGMSEERVKEFFAHEKPEPIVKAKRKPPPHPTVAEGMHERLFGCERAIRFLYERGVSRDAAVHFRLGYATWYGGSIAIPHYSCGTLMGIKLRVIDATPKLRYRAFPHSRFAIYNGDSLSGVIVEGEFKVIHLWQIGIDAVGLPAGQLSADIIAELRGKPLLYVRDNDRAGLESAVEMRRVFGDDVHITSTPSEKAIDDYLVVKGRDEWTQRLKAAAKLYMKSGSDGQI